MSSTSFDTLNIIMDVDTKMNLFAHWYLLLVYDSKDSSFVGHSKHQQATYFQLIRLYPPPAEKVKGF